MSEFILYSGVPGSGKTYKMVSDLYKTRGQYYVVHNIDGLKDDFLQPMCLNFVDYCKENDLEISDFFSKEYQTEFCEKVYSKYNKNVLVVIDEAQEWFSKLSQNLKMWLSYHRHLNQVIWLVAHRATNIPPIYRSFLKEEFRAKSSSLLNLPFVFFYNRIVAGERVGYITCVKSKKIFSLYKSQNDGFKKKKPSAFLPIVLVIVIGAVYLFFRAPSMIFDKGRPKSNTSSVSASSSSVTTASNLPSVALEGGSEVRRYLGKVNGKVVLESANGAFFLGDLPEKRLVLEDGDSFVKIHQIGRKGEVYYMRGLSEREKRAFSTEKGGFLAQTNQTGDKNDLTK